MRAVLATASLARAARYERARTLMPGRDVADVVGEFVRADAAALAAIGPWHSPPRRTLSGIVAAFAIAALIGALIILFWPISAHAEIASCYGNEHGQNRTATGEHYNPAGLTAAHRTLPFGTTVAVINPRNGRAVTVRINDRGPFVRGRDIDLSLGACAVIGLQLGPVQMQVLGR
jgi:hypothetical protein